MVHQLFDTLRITRRELSGDNLGLQVIHDFTTDGLLILCLASPRNQTKNCVEGNDGDV